MRHVQILVLMAAVMLSPAVAVPAAWLGAAQTAADPLPGGPGQPGVAQLEGNLPGEPAIELRKVLTVSTNR